MNTKRAAAMLGVMLVTVLATSAFAAEPAPTSSAKTSAKAKSDPSPHFEATQVLEGTGTVLWANAKTREIGILREIGDTLTVVAGAEVKNFPQIKVGDIVKVKVTEKLSIRVEPAGDPEMTEELQTAQAKLGEKPAASATHTTTYKATITAINKEKGTATLKGYEGDEFEVTPRNKSNLDKVQVGQLVVFKYSVGVAASVVKVSAK